MFETKAPMEGNKFFGGAFFMPAKIIKLIVYRMNRQNVIYLKKYTLFLSQIV